MEQKSKILIISGAGCVLILLSICCILSVFAVPAYLKTRGEIVNLEESEKNEGEKTVDDEFVEEIEEPSEEENTPSPFEDLEEYGVLNDWELFQNSSCGFSVPLPSNSIEIDKVDFKAAKVWHIQPFGSSLGSNRSDGWWLYYPKAEGFSASYVTIVIQCASDLKGRSVDGIQPQEYVDRYVSPVLKAENITKVDKWGREVYSYTLDLSEYSEPETRYLFDKNGKAYTLILDVREGATEEITSEATFVFENVQFE